MKNPLLTLPPNTQGRDFVIGDLHGSLSCLVNLLGNLEFDPAVDRVISVGDLVDRGPDSAGCLQLLYEPWFFATFSNHEQMMLEAFGGGYIGQFWIQNGGQWGLPALLDFQAGRRSDSASTDIIDALEKVRELPYVITIEKTDGTKVHVVHAEFPPYTKITDELLTDPDFVRRLVTHTSNDGEFLLWGRHVFYNFAYQQLLEPKVKRSVAYNYKMGQLAVFNDRLSHIISGHTIVQRPLTILGQTNVDTCAFGSYRSQATGWERLTAVELSTWKFYQATADKFFEVQPLVVNIADIEEIENGKASSGDST